MKEERSFDGMTEKGEKVPEADAVSLYGNGNGPGA